jgi:hypothetical protein
VLAGLSSTPFPVTRQLKHHRPRDDEKKVLNGSTEEMQNSFPTHAANQVTKRILTEKFVARVCGAGRISPRL